MPPSTILPSSIPTPRRSKPSSRPLSLRSDLNLLSDHLSATSISPRASCIPPPPTTPQRPSALRSTPIKPSRQTPLRTPRRNPLARLPHDNVDSVSDRTQNTPRRIAPPRQPVMPNPMSTCPSSPPSSPTPPTASLPKEDPSPPFTPWDQDAIAATPSKKDNDRWLRNFGIDLAPLRAAGLLPEADISSDSDDDDDVHPNPVMRFTPESDDENVHPNIEASPMRTPVKQITPIAPKSLPSPPTPPPSQPVAHVAQVTPARPPRRSMGGEELRRALTPARSRSRRISTRELRSVQIDATGVGSEVFLTPVRATPRLRAQLGVDTVVTPVRRSLRLSAREMEVPLVGADDGAEKVLKSTDYAYAPNKNLV